MTPPPISPHEVGEITITRAEYAALHRVVTRAKRLLDSLTRPYPVVAHDRALLADAIERAREEAKR